ncbi:unnamed protein product, partial [Arabidopsis halleri]
KQTLCVLLSLFIDNSICCVCCRNGLRERQLEREHEDVHYFTWSRRPGLSVNRSIIGWVHSVLVLSVSKFSIHSDILKFRFGFGSVPVLSVLKFSIHSVILLRIFSDISVIFEYFWIYFGYFRVFLLFLYIF